MVSDTYTPKKYRALSIFIRMERFLFCTIRKKDLIVLGSLAPTRDQWEGPATNCIYFGTLSLLISFEIDTISCGRAFSPIL
jgi:hypothetical protein